MGHELDPLLDCLLVADLANLDKCGEFQVLARHFFDQGLHSGREHQKSFEVLLTGQHLLLLALDESLLVAFVEVLRDLADDCIHRVFQVVIDHFIGFIKYDEKALIEH